MYQMFSEQLTMAMNGHNQPSMHWMLSEQLAMAWLRMGSLSVALHSVTQMWIPVFVSVFTVQAPTLTVNERTTLVPWYIVMT